MIVLACLLATLIIESLLAYLLGFRKKTDQINLALINCITNPLLVTLNFLRPLSLLQIVFCEAIIILVEFLLLGFAARKFSHQLFTLSLALNLGSAVLGLCTSLLFYPELATMLRCHLSKSPVHCLENKIGIAINQHPQNTKQTLDHISNLWSFVYSTDKNSFSDSIHMIGMTLGQNAPDIQTAIRQCSRNWNNACIHGAVMGYLTNRPFSNICASLSDKTIAVECIHGMGHVLWLNHTTATLDSVLDGCKSWQDDEFFACASGILMEYSKGTIHGRVASIDLPCKDLLPEYQEICVASQNSYARYYSPDIK